MHFLNRLLKNKATDLWRWIFVLAVMITALYYKAAVFSFYKKVFYSFFEFLKSFIKPVNVSIIEYYSNYGLYLMLFLLVTYLFQKKTVLSFFSSVKKFRYQEFFISIALFAFFEVLIVSFEIILNHNDYVFNFKLSGFIELFFVALLVLPIKVILYELLFRSYLLQFFGTMLSEKWMIIVASAVLSTLIITLVSYNFSLGKIPSHLVFYVFCSGLALASVVLLRDGVEMSMGMLFANNFVSTVFISFNWYNLSTDALFFNNSSSPDILLNYYFGALSYLLYLKVIIHIFKITDWKERLLGRI